MKVDLLNKWFKLTVDVQSIKIVVFVKNNDHKYGNFTMKSLIDKILFLSDAS